MACDMTLDRGRDKVGGGGGGGGGLGVHNVGGYFHSASSIGY